MKFAIWMTLTVGVGWCPTNVYAHAVGIEAKQKGTQVVVEGYFDDNSPADDAKVTVEDETGTVIDQGKTDANGKWSFATPNPGKYKVKLDAGAGHRATTTLTITDPATKPTVEANEQTVSEGPTRGEFTRTPWVKMAIGLALLGSIAMLFWWRKRSKLTTLGLFCCCMLPVACSKQNKQQPVFPLEGTVLVDGQPAVGAVVMLYPAADLLSSVRPRGLVGQDSRFTLTSYVQDDGAAPGEYKITIEWRQPDDHPEQGTNRLPAHYADPRLTKLTATINAGANEPLALRISRKN